jgi:6-pyruvoyltetrahydropterin/6-carboxytetrahydropterin synthase
VRVFKAFAFEAAHRLPFVPAEHKCARLHGHSYRVVVLVEGAVSPDTGMVLDFGDISAAFKPIIEQHLDHRCLNDVDGLENPTSENLARWIWERLAPSLPGLATVEVHETDTAGCVYEGPE